MKINQYFNLIEQKVKDCYDVAEVARAKGLDPVTKVEVPQAKYLAEKVVGIISILYPQIIDNRLIDRIIELEKKYGKLEPAVALVIAEEVAKERFCKFKNHKEAMEAGVRVALGYMTLGVVSSPIEGFIRININKTEKEKDYFAPFYSGPIRSAGGTEAAFSLVVVDYLREVFGYAKYDPKEDEVKRGVHECYEYHERVTNLQYLPSEVELEFLMKNIPVQVSGDPSDDREVYNYKDLPRVETNLIRSGFALVMGEGIAQKAPKIYGRVTKLKELGFKLSGWDWLGEFVKLQKKIKENKSSGNGAAGATYIQDIVAGRPVFAHPSRSGGLRLRYGRARNTGYSCLGISPATMAVCDDFIASGTQLRIEKPTKGCTIASCDGIDGPIIKLTNGSVRRINGPNVEKKIVNKIKEIVYLGDLLVPYGDFLNRNHNLLKPGYVEEWWLEELINSGGKVVGKIENFEQALGFSKKYKIPLYPEFIYFWSQIGYEGLLSLLDWLVRGRISEGKLIFPYGNVDRERFVIGKRALEFIGCEHEVGIENVVLNKKDSEALLFNLGINIEDANNKFEESIDQIIKSVKIYVDKEKDRAKNVLDIINCLCEVEIKDKAGTFIGARMGRPEKAKLRKLTGSPNVLFPIGEEGGRLRSLQAAIEKGSVKAEFSNFYCDICKTESIYSKCNSCKGFCRKYYYCVKCGMDYPEKCPEHEVGKTFKEKRIDVKSYFDSAKKVLKLRIEELPVVIKGVRGTSNEEHDCENLAKGLLRAKYNLHVNKDGTIRYDVTEMPLTHFKPKEIGTSVDKLKEMGYEVDVYGKKLENEDQVLEIFPHDLILPACPSSSDENADDVFLNVTKFVNDELELLYELKKFYNTDNKESIIGELFTCIAPHICSAVVGRVIGFSKVQALLASPYIHAACRRDCDGDEIAVMLLMDVLLNFSKKFLPSHRGGTQDAPLVLNSKISAGEVDDMIFDLDIGKNIPLDLYRAAEKEEHPSSVKMEQVKSRLGGGNEFNELFYSIASSDINAGITCSSYKTLPSMREKVEKQMGLCKKIRAVDTSDVARLVIERHFIRDIRGNLRKFSMQVFRCVGCNSKFRRPPLAGKCTKCGGRIIFTISEGSIIKYMQGALDLARNFNVNPYLLECLELTQKDIDGIFGKEKEKQENLGRWF